MEINNNISSTIPLVDIVLVFCYVFSFYVIGPLTSSVIIALPLMFCCLYKKKWGYCLLLELKNSFIVRIFISQWLLIGIAVFYSCLHLTMELEYIKVLIAQMFHFICGIFIIIYLKYQKQYTTLKIEQTIIWAFLVQSIIQLIAMSIPSFAHFILYFSRAHDLQDAYGGGVRGLALSSGVGWSLGLAYGLIYIVFVKRYLLSGVNMKSTLIGILLLMGTIFAGRTGFVWACLGGIFFIISNQLSYRTKLMFVLKILLGVILFFLCIYFLFPSMTEHLVDNVFPFAFEPFYKMYYNDEFSTSSTDRLEEMWRVSTSVEEILYGSGSFIDTITGAYYKHIDIGILRNLFYWGIGGYILLIIYQLILIAPIKYNKIQRVSHFNMFFYKLLIIVYLFLLECKAVTIGLNKMTFSVIFLIAYFYFDEIHSKKYIAELR